MTEKTQTARRSLGDGIESRPDVLAGEPVLKGTRVPARHVAEMLRQGATLAEIVAEFDLSPDQVEAAASFGRVGSDEEPPRRSRARRGNVSPA